MPTLSLVRQLSRRTDKDTIIAQLNEIAGKGLGGGTGRGYGWSHDIQVGDYSPTDAGWSIFANLTFYKSKKGTETVEREQWDKIYPFVRSAGFSKKFADTPWRIVGDDEDQEIECEEEEGEIEDKKIGEISLERGNFFDRLYGLDTQIEVILSALRVAKDTNYKKRFHCLLYGSTACGKTETLKCVGEMLGREGNEYMKFNATSLTQPGVLKILKEADVVPAVLLIEEIEKCEESNLRWLLDLLDSRAEIRKTNYRESWTKSVPMLCLATVNDPKLFNAQLKGALGSRFPHQIKFPRPSREILKRILEREIVETSGDIAWVEPALDWAENNEVGDPRRIIAVALCGREKLLTGEYQRWLQEVSNDNHDIYIT